MNQAIKAQVPPWENQACLESFERGFYAGSKAANSLDVLRAEIVHVARSNLGFGEEGSNNRGDFIDAIGGRQGREWCAAYAGYCIERACERLGRDMPIERSLGAKRLTKNVGKYGRMFGLDEIPEPGDLVCWHRRTGLISWRGHVGVVEEVRVGAAGYLVTVLEGNRGGFPSKVSRYTYQVVGQEMRELGRSKPQLTRFFSYASVVRTTR